MRLHRANQRRGVILMVVLALLTLFAIVGITFVLYADSEAAAARVAREAETAQRADMEPEQALALFLGQFLYDVEDNLTGVGSGLRGHSLARTMYGYNYTTIGVPVNVNNTAFNGSGRLHTKAGAFTNPVGTDDYLLVNYTWFSKDGFVHDPERYGTAARANPNTAQTNYYVGGNAPYTYPDLNNFFLAAVKADGTVVTPSFHRKWLFNPTTPFNDMTNPNWTKPEGKYLILRPRPAEHPGFPVPEDPTGDVKNLVGAPGGNDSIWIDIGAPVMTAPDGTLYKMLVAPLIIDLDGRINLNTAGNILGPGNTHVSNHGLGPWEVNLAKVLYGDQTAMNPPTQYIKLIFNPTVAGQQTIYGRYGANGTPAAPGTVAPSSTSPHFYAPVDVNGRVDLPNPGGYSARPTPPGYGGVATSPFPVFDPKSYLNGGPTENTNHPLLFDYFRSPFYNGTDDRVFRVSDMEALLRPNNNFTQLTNKLLPDSGSSALINDLIRLSPINFGPSASQSRFSNLVTTLSMDLGVPGVIPYWWATGGALTAPYPSAVPNPLTAPLGAAVPFPPVPPTAAVTNNLAAMPPNPSEFGADWKAVSAGLRRIRLNRPLPPYPHMGSGQMPPYQAPLVTWGTSYTLTAGPIATQYQAALSARQILANDLYRRLLALTGVTPVVAPAAPTPTELIPRRWLAQLAVNIVDFIDEDDISTPFNFYNDNDGLAPANIGAQQGTDDNAVNMATPTTGRNPIYWVFGTELPKVVLNEVLAEAQNSDPAIAGVTGESVKVWLELFNTMQVPPAAPNAVQQQDGYRIPLYMSLPAGGGYSPYRVTISQNLMLSGGANPLPDTSANVLGKASIVAPFPQSADLTADFAVAANLIGGGKQAASVPPVPGAGIDPQGLFLIGPPAPGAPYQDPFVAAAGMNPGVPPATPVVRTTNPNAVAYTPVWPAASTTDERTTGLTVALRRLANPYLPYNPNPVNASGVDPTYNPFMTVDYLQNVKIQTNTPAGPYSSLGKRQPYAAKFIAGAVPNVPNPAVSPVVNQTGPQVVATVTSTFGNRNAPMPSTGTYDWLVHLDRQLVSPMELLHVSGYQPYLLTQQFVVPAAGSTGDNNAVLNMFKHYVPWLDLPPAGIPVGGPWWFDTTLAAGTTHRLYRLFEFLECGDRAFGVDALGRIPGRVNINTIWDPEILRALADANPSIGMANDVPIDTIFANMLAARTPGLTTVGPTDRPFLPLSTGFVPGGPNTQFPNGISVNTDTLLRLGPPPAMAGQPQLLMFQSPTDIASGNTPPLPQYVHPYMQTQLLTKLYNNVTTRSNAFAVFLTVGFFQVIDAATSPPTLGAEIGRAEGRQVRHRMFAIVDRTNLSVFRTLYAGPAITVTPASGPVTLNSLTFNPLSGTNANGLTWTIGAGSVVVFEPGTDNEETVVLGAGAGAGTFLGKFSKSHAPGVAVIQRGNPGPPVRYDPRQDPLVVPYFSIID
jgi:hypothetical protein